MVPLACFEVIEEIIVHGHHPTCFNDHQHFCPHSIPDSALRDMSGEDISFDFIGRPSAQCQVPDAPADPTPEQEEKLQEIISRFADEEYRLPDVVEDEEKDGRLTEAEQMFLVSPVDGT